jgi:hypothetical protein
MGEKMIKQCKFQAGLNIQNLRGSVNAEREEAFVVVHDQRARSGN